MKLSRILIGAAVIAGAQLGHAVRAADAQEVKSILANVPVFVPTGADGKVKPVQRENDKKKVSVLFAAMSPSAASLLLDQVIRPAEGKSASDIKFSVMPLTQFREAAAALKNNATTPVEMAFVPDPSQEGPAVSLLTSQGIKKDLAVTVARSQPVFFCPEPLITVKQRVNSQDRVFSPCGQDFVQMSLLIFGSNLKANRPGLQAVPLSALEESLLAQPSDKIKNLLLLPTAATEQALQSSTKTNATNGSAPKKSK